MKITELSVGQFVQSATITQGGNPDRLVFVGHVVGLTVNLMGEPIARIKMVVRKSAYRNAEVLKGLGYTPVDRVGEFWTQESDMHPANIEPLQEGTILKENT